MNAWLTVLLVLLFHLEPLSKAMSEQLPFLPYLVLLQVLRTHPSGSEEGVTTRAAMLAEGVAHQVLASLSAFGHHRPRAKAPHTLKERSK